MTKNQRRVAAICAVLNPAQAALDRWIRRGGLRRANLARERRDR
jgi:hypothetical protein